MCMSGYMCADCLLDNKGRKMVILSISDVLVYVTRVVPPTDKRGNITRYEGILRCTKAQNMILSTPKRRASPLQTAPQRLRLPSDHGTLTLDRGKTGMGRFHWSHPIKSLPLRRLRHAPLRASSCTPSLLCSGHVWRARSAGAATRQLLVSTWLQP